MSFMLEVPKTKWRDKCVLGEQLKYYFKNGYGYVDGWMSGGQIDRGMDRQRNEWWVDRQRNGQIEE